MSTPIVVMEMLYLGAPIAHRPKNKGSRYALIGAYLKSHLAGANEWYVIVQKLTIVTSRGFTGGKRSNCTPLTRELVVEKENAPSGQEGWLVR